MFCNDDSPDAKSRTSILNLFLNTPADTTPAAAATILKVLMRAVREV